MNASTILAIVLLGINSVASATDEDDVRSRDDQERRAALARNVAALEELWLDDLTVNAPNNQVAVGKRAVMDTFVRSGIINFSSFERSIEFLKVDRDFAIIMGAETLVPLSDAPAAGLTAGKKTVRRFTNIWKKQAGVWRLYWRHANVIPTP